MAKVKINRNKYLSIKFKDVKVGQVFECEDEIYLCIDNRCLAVVLMDDASFGCVQEFAPDEYVHVFENAEIIINLYE